MEKDLKTIGLFGCNTEKGWVSRYEKILIKFFIEDEEFFLADGKGVDPNVFGAIPEIRFIIGTYKEMYARDGVRATYDQLYAELSRKYGDDSIRMDIIKETLDDIRELEISDDEKVVYKNQFKDWINFTVATKIMNLWSDFIKNDIRNGDRERMYSVMGKMKELASNLPEREIKRSPKDWN